MKQSTLAFGDTQPSSSSFSRTSHFEGVELTLSEDNGKRVSPSACRQKRGKEKLDRHGRNANSMLKQGKLGFASQPLEVVDLLSSEDEAVTQDVQIQQKRSTWKRLASPLQPDNAKKANTSFSAVPLPSGFKFSSVTQAAAYDDKISVPRISSSYWHNRVVEHADLTQLPAIFNFSSPNVPVAYDNKTGLPNARTPYWEKHVDERIASTPLPSASASMSYPRDTSAEYGERTSVSRVRTPSYAQILSTASSFSAHATIANKDSADASRVGRPYPAGRIGGQETAQSCLSPQPSGVWRNEESTALCLNAAQSTANESRRKKDGTSGSHAKIVQSTIQAAFARAVALPTNGSSLPQPQHHSHILKQLKLAPIIPPKKVESAHAERMQTRLPVANLMERIWLYETLVRFDIIQTPKRVLQKLDRFDDWTEEQIHVILVTVATFLAGLKTLRQGEPMNMYKDLIIALRQAGHDCTLASKAWDIASKVCEANHVALVELEVVELPPEMMAERIGDDAIDAIGNDTVDSTSSETLLSSRAIRSRRAANKTASARLSSLAKQSLATHIEDEKSSRATSISVLGIGESSDDSSDDSDNFENLVVRYSSRQAAKIFAERESTEGESDEDSGGNDGDSVSCRIADDSPEFDQQPITAEERRSATDTQGYIAEEGKLPPFERRIAILSGMLTLLMQHNIISQEVSDGVKQIEQARKSKAENYNEHMKEKSLDRSVIFDRKAEMEKAGKIEEWQAQLMELQEQLSFASLSWNVDAFLVDETHKPRSGPIGHDADNNEYWHLTEFNEIKPLDISGHWAWSLLVLGTPLSVPRRHVDEGEVRQKSESLAQSGPANVSEDHQSSTITSHNDNNVQQDQRCAFYAINSVEEMQKLIAYVSYRCRMIEYEEKVAERTKREELYQQDRAAASNSETRTATEALPSIPSQSPAVARTSTATVPATDEDSTSPLQQARQKLDEESQQLALTQDMRRRSTNQLTKRLTLYIDYHRWHEMNRRV